MLKPEMLNAFVQSKGFHAKLAQRAVRLLNRSYRDKILFMHKGLSRFAGVRIYRGNYILSAPLHYVQQALKTGRSGHNSKINNIALEKPKPMDSSIYFVDGSARRINSPAAAKKTVLLSMPVIKAVKSMFGRGVAEAGRFSIIHRQDYKMAKKLKSYSLIPPFKFRHRAVQAQAQAQAQVQAREKTSATLAAFKDRPFIMSASKKPVMVQAMTVNSPRQHHTGQESEEIRTDHVASHHAGAEFARSVASSLIEILAADLQKSGYHAGSAPVMMINPEEMQGITSQSLMTQAGVQTGPTGFDYALTLAHPSGAY